MIENNRTSAILSHQNLECVRLKSSGGGEANIFAFRDDPEITGFVAELRSLENNVVQTLCIPLSVNFRLTVTANRV